MNMGIVCFNLLTLITKNAYFLSGIVFGALLVGCLMPLFEIEETPEFMLYTTSNHKYLDLVEVYRSKNGLKKDLEERQKMDKIVNEHIGLLETIETNYREEIYSPWSRLKKMTNYWYPLLALSLIGGFMNTLWVAIILNLQNIGFDDISSNGIALGMIGLLSNLIVAPILGRMERRRWLIIFQSCLLGSEAFLFLLYKLDSKRSIYFTPLEVTVTLLIIGTVVNAMMVPFYYSVSENFPANLRGTASSLIQMASYLIPVSAPWLCYLSEHWKTHFLVGCSLVGLVSLPLTFFLRETLH